MLYCKYCGDKIEDGEKFCDKCGKPTPLNDLKNNLSKKVSGPKKDIFSFIDIDQEKAEKYIKYAYYASLVSLILTIFMSLTELPEISYYWLDVVIIALLCYGIRKKYTFSAVSMFLYFLLSKYFQIAEGSVSAISWIVAFIIGAIYLMGIVGVYKYHHLTGYEKNTRGGVVYGIIVGFLGLAIVGFIGFSSLYPYYSESAILYRADYQDGYKAGYTDGRSSTAEIGDEYNSPATEEREDAYYEGYMNGLLDGCNENGEFDCTEIESAVDEMYDTGTESSI